MINNTAGEAMTIAISGRLPAHRAKGALRPRAPKRWVGMAELIRRWLRLALGSKPGLPRVHRPGEWSFGRGGWTVSPCARALASVTESSVKILPFAYPSTSFDTL
ncbi:hypothetical protein HDV63DRAFT_371829 [Trichoderma sp. SZMC 28014]